MCVLAVVASAVTLVMPRAIAWADEAKRQGCAERKAALNAAVEQWYFLKGNWPNRNLADMGADAEYFPRGLPTCPVDGSAYELDPVRHRVLGHGH